MNKSEATEVIRLTSFRAAGADDGMLARCLSAMIRASMTKRSRAALIAVAAEWNLSGHPEFII